MPLFELEGYAVQLFGDGQQVRGFNYVDDVVEALLIAGANDKVKGDYFNLGGERAVALEEFVKLLLKAAGRGSYRIVPFPGDKKAIDVGSVQLRSTCSVTRQLPGGQKVFRQACVLPQSVLLTGLGQALFRQGAVGSSY